MENLHKPIPTGEDTQLLSNLLKSIQPFLSPNEYIFTTVAPDLLKNVDQDKILGFFREAESVTLILEKSFADTNDLSYSSVMGLITLQVYSSLEAVGLTAAFSNALAKQNISCNVIAGYFHDHIFVPIRQVHEAMEVLKNLSK